MGVSLTQAWIHLARGASIGRVVGFFGNLILSRLLGPAQLGIFSLIINTVQTGEVLSRVGADYALNYELGSNNNRVLSPRGIKYVRATAQLITISTIILCILCTFWIFFANGLFPLSIDLRGRLLLGSLLVLILFLEGITSSAWEIILVSQRTLLLSFKQGIFYPLRVISASAGGYLYGLTGAVFFWLCVSFVQAFLLKIALGKLWQPFGIVPFMSHYAKKILKRGTLFYLSNILSALAFYPLLIKVSSESGLASVGYLRIGQILQQIFAFLPGTLVPILFLKLRSQDSFKQKVAYLEKPFKAIWLLLNLAFLVYLLSDEILINVFFGPTYRESLFPTRLLLLVTLYESLSQLIFQPTLASGHTASYSAWQNLSAFVCALFGWYLIPQIGLSGFLISKLLYAVIPFIGLGYPLLRACEPGSRPILHLVVTFAWSSLIVLQALSLVTVNTLVFNLLILLTIALLLSVYIPQLQISFQLPAMLRRK